jgi:hypothetical protein
VHSQVAHPLQVGHHPQRRYQHAEVTGHRLLEGEDLEALVLDRLAGPVDVRVRADDAFGELRVRAEQCRGGLPGGLLDATGHRDQVGDHARQLFVVHLTHAREGRWGRCPVGDTP